MPVVEMHAIVSGRVQGVGFRATARAFAREIGLAGSAKNLPNGNVEIYAQGTREQLEELVGRLSEYFDIQSIDIDYTEAREKKQGFDIAF